MNATQSALIKKARHVRDAARAAGDFRKSNEINFYLYLIEQAGDKNPATAERLERLCTGGAS